MIHLGTITEHAKFYMNIEYKAEQQLPLLGFCSNAGAFTRRTYLVFSLPARQTIKWYCADTSMKVAITFAQAGVYITVRVNSDKPSYSHPYCNRFGCRKGLQNVMHTDIAH